METNECGRVRYGINYWFELKSDIIIRIFIGPGAPRKLYISEKLNQLPLYFSYISFENAFKQEIFKN